MFEDLERAISELDIPAADGEAIARALALRTRLDAVIAAAVADFDKAKLWDLDAATSMVAWLRDHAGLSRRAAARMASMARQVSKLPVTASAWASGTLSEGKVEAVLANLRPTTIDTFANHETELVPVLAPLPVTAVAQAMGAWAARAEADGNEPNEPDEPSRVLHLSSTLDSRWVLDGDLDPEGGQTVATALRLAESRDAEGEPARLPTERRADALVDVCRFFLDHQQNCVGGRHRPHLNVVVNANDLLRGGSGRFIDGSTLDGPSTQRLACDAALHRVVVGGRSAILDYGRATRTIPAPLWNALVVRDEHCRFPGCDRPSVWCEGHHVRWVSDGGPTRLDNLVLACTRHHHRLHQPGWAATLAEDGTLEVTDPTRQVRSTVPPRSLPLVC